MLPFGLEHPVQVPCPALDEVRHVGFEEHVHRQTLTRFLDERNIQLADDLAARPVAAKKEAGLDLVRLVGRVVADRADDDVWRVRGPREGQECRVEAESPPVMYRPPGEDRLELGLREVDVVARAGGVVVALLRADSQRTSVGR
jgi:hypothetical protein